jgi:putative BNR repeat neuraminidase
MNDSRPSRCQVRRHFLFSARVQAISLLTGAFLGIACVGRVALCQAPAVARSEGASVEPANNEPSQGVWYTPGTFKGYARGVTDYPPEKYACVYPGKQTVYSGPMATYCAWHRPMAIYASEVDKTFFVFGNPENSPAISYYDHQQRTFAEPVVLGTNPNGDAHRNPTLLIDGSGIITVFFGAHFHPTRVVKSTRPYDISKWTAATAIGKKTSYPQPWELTPGEIFVSYRSSPPAWCYRRSTNGAESWSPETKLIDFAGTSIYAVTIAETGSFPRKIHVAWSRMGGGTTEEIRTKALWARRYNVYYACSDDGGTTWRRSDGNAYTLPIGERRAEKVFDSATHGVWLKDIQLDSQGTPYLLFVDADVKTYECTWKTAGLSIEGWTVSDVAQSDHMYDAGSLAILSDDDFRIWGPTAVSQPYEDGGEIEEFQSIDRGATWARTDRLTTDSNYSHNQVKTVFNHQKGDFRIIWSYGDSNYPPTTQNVYLFFYGEGEETPARVRFPSP